MALTLICCAVLATCALSVATSKAATTNDATSIAGSEIKLMSSMSTLLESKDPLSPKAKLQRKLVGLIWLEKVLQQNLDSMDEASYSAEIAEGKAKVAKDATPATAAMLSQMRTEINEYSVPFYQEAVKDELKRLKKRQKALLNQIIAIDAGEDGEEVATAEEDDSEEEAKEPEKGKGDDKEAEDVKSGDKAKEEESGDKAKEEESGDKAKEEESDDKEAAKEEESGDEEAEKKDDREPGEPRNSKERADQAKKRLRDPVGELKRAHREAEKHTKEPISANKMIRQQTQTFFITLMCIVATVLFCVLFVVYRKVKQNLAARADP